MYNVKVIIKTTDPKNPTQKWKPASITGLFIPKGKQSQTSTIEKEVIAHFSTKLKEKHPELEFSYKVISTKIKSEFCIQEQ